MGQKHIILIVILITFWGCYTNKPAKPQTAMANLTKQELIAINKSLSAQIRGDFRSWSYNEPEKWKFFADKFADEVVRSCPDALSQKEQIAEVFLNHLKQRASIINSKSLLKKSQMGTSSAEFKYNLSFLIGIEGYQKWQLMTKNEYQKYKARRDSLNEVVTYSYNKFSKTKRTKL